MASLGGRSLTQREKEQLMSQHATTFAALSAETKQYYARKAEHLKARKEHVRDMRVLDIETSLRRAEEATPRVEVGSTSLNLLRNNKFSDEAVVALAHRCNAASDKAQSHKSVFLKALQSPVMPPVSVRQSLERYKGRLSNEREVFAFPAWVKDVCKARDHLRGVMFRMPKADHGHVYMLFVFAFQSPYQCLFLQCDHFSRATAADMPPENPQVIEAMSWLEHVFRPIPDSFIEAEHQQVRAVDSAAVCVYPHVSWDKTGMFVTDGSPMEWDVFKGSLPETEVTRSGADPQNRPDRKRKHSAAESALIIEHPWLFDGLGTALPQPSQNLSVAHGERAIDEDMENMDDLDKAWSEFQHQQAAWKEEHETTSETHFATGLRGGRWTQAFRGTPVDTVTAQAVTAEGRLFLQQFGLSRMFTCSILKYGRDVAGALCDLWCGRMHHAFAAWMDDPSSHDVAQVPLCDLPLDARQVAVLEGLPVHSPGHDRLQQVLSIDIRRRQDLACRCCGAVVCLQASYHKFRTGEGFQGPEIASFT